MHFARARGARRFEDGALLHLSGAAGNADHDTWSSDADATDLERLLNEVIEHPRGHVEVGDHAVAKRTRGDDVRRCPTDHRFGLLADREDRVVDPVDRDDRGFVDDDPAAAQGDERVGGAEIDSYIGRESSSEPAEWRPGHGDSSESVAPQRRRRTPCICEGYVSLSDDAHGQMYRVINDQRTRIRGATCTSYTSSVAVWFPFLEPT